MMRKRIIINRMLLAAPWLTLALLLGMSHWLPNRAEFSPESEVRKRHVAAAMANVPFFIGEWVGEDDITDVPREAQQLLHPNALLCRKYRSFGGAEVRLLVVHCGDARDMIGHYPPICYPSAGWLTQDSAPPSDLSLTLNSNGEAAVSQLPVRQYRFHRIRERGRDDVIRVFNAFVLPDGTVTREIDDINEQSERLAVSIQGVAQIQIITSGLVDQSTAIQSSQELLSGMTGMLTALSVGERLGAESGEPGEGALP